MPERRRAPQPSSRGHPKEQPRWGRRLIAHARLRLRCLRGPPSPLACALERVMNSRLSHQLWPEVIEADAVHSVRSSAGEE